MLDAADYVFYQSDYSRTAVRCFLKAPACPSEVLHNAVDTSLFRPAAARRPSDKFVLLTTDLVMDSARMRMLAHLIESLRALKTMRTDWVWHFAGSLQVTDAPDYRGEVNALIDENGLREFVRLTDSFEMRASASVYAGASIYLHDKYNDACPNAVLEAMACGLPVVYGATGGVAELVGDDAGVGIKAPSSWDQIVAPDPAEYAVGISNAMDRLEELSQNARRKAVEKFDVKNWIARHRAVFGKLTRLVES
jgi:glycosyltransferase involved in cell wall biosynthesis